MSSISINHVILAGYLTRDPEVHGLPSGENVCRMRLALNSLADDGEGGRQEMAQFFEIAVYGKQGEAAGKWLRKGEPVYVDGRLDWREWSTGDAQRRESVRVVARRVQFLGRAQANPQPDQTEDPLGEWDDETAQYVVERLGPVV